MEIYVLLIFLVVCSFLDIKRQKVSNVFIVLGVGVLIPFVFLSDGYFGVLMFLGNFILFQAVFMLLWICGFFGAADIKIFSVVLSVVGWECLTSFLVCFLIACGVMILASAFKRGHILFRLLQVKRYIYACITSKKLFNYRSLFKESDEGKLPFVPVIMLGYCIFLLCEMTSV